MTATAAEQLFSFLFLCIVACSSIPPPPIQEKEIAHVGNYGSTLTTSSSSPINGVKCKNEEGKDVDWFIIYKLPKSRTSSNQLVREGLAYAYIEPAKVKVEVEQGKEGFSGWDGAPHGRGRMDTILNGEGERTNNPNPGISQDRGRNEGSGGAGWVLSTKGIHSPESIVGLSLRQIYEKGNQDIAFLTYNDQPPVGPTVYGGGHSKGIIVTSLASGFWIQHSVPHFPLISSSSINNYTYPQTGRNNGQVFHCISLPTTKDVDDLGRIFEITKPHVVNSSFPTDSFKEALPELMKIVKKQKHQRSSSPHLGRVNGMRSMKTKKLTSRARSLRTDHACVNEINAKQCLIKQLLNADKAPKTAKDWDQVEIRTADGRILRAYAKGPSFHEDIYSSQLAPIYKTPLEVQSWLNGPNPFSSNCSSTLYPVHNIERKSVAGVEFSTHNDHSKWALSSKQEQPLICISDLNRMEHQLKRGGVAVCFTDSELWMTFNKSIIDVQPCPTRLPTAAAAANATETKERRADDDEVLAQNTSTSSSSSSSATKTSAISPVTVTGLDGNNEIYNTPTAAVIVVHE